MQPEEHHKRAAIATNRPAYREARWERAVKVYTVNQESRYLLVQNVHALGVTQELLQLFSLYGDIQEYRILDEYPCEPYTDVYWVKFVDISAARLAKRKLDDKSFFGKNIHVSYAPEFESVEETRDKLQQRKMTIVQKTKEARIKAQREKKKEQQKQREELSTHMTKDLHTAAVVVAECPPQMGHTAEKMSPIPISIDFEEPPSHAVSPSTQSLAAESFPQRPPSQTSLLKQTSYSGLRGTQTTTSTPHFPQPLPLLPPPTGYGGQSPHYPSQTAHIFMGGALPLASPREKTTATTNTHHHRTTTSKIEREKGLKRRLEDSGSAERTREKEGLCDVSGLTTSQRVAAFLENKDGGSKLSSTKVFAKGPPTKKITQQQRTSSREQFSSKVGVVGESCLGEKTPVPSEGYFPVSQHPPVQTGNRSVDSSVQAVRNKMNKVWDEGVHVPVIQQSKRPKKRKRI